MASECLVISWSQNPGRAEAIADVVGGQVCAPYPLQLGRSALARYFLSLPITLAALVRHRPRVVVAQNPPFIPAALGWAWTALRGGTLVIDAHPASFGAKGNKQGRLMLPVSRWLSRRAGASLVTVDAFVRELDGWGARGLVVHEPPVAPRPRAVSRPDARPAVLFACVFAEDEPVREVVEAARTLPDVDFLVTGRPERSPVSPDELPPNCRLTGYLDLDAFLDLMAASSAVLSLTDEETSVARSAYEATYLGVPLVISDVVAMVENFPSARPCANTAASIAEAVSAVVSSPPSPNELKEARRVQRQRWDRQRESLLIACGIERPEQ